MDDDELDGCDVDMSDPEHAAVTDDQVDSVVMFADVWDDPDKVEARKQELQAWGDALRDAT